MAERVESNEGGGNDRGPPAPHPWARWLVHGSLLLACVPIVAAIYHGVTGDWYPIGDNGYFVIRARDVLTRDHPLVGAWSSGSAQLADSINNLGPLQLDLLAPFVKVAPVAGTAIGVGAVQLASVAGVWVTLRRISTPLVVIVAMVVTISIEWSMGSAMLIETRQHQYLVLPFLCFLTLVWAISLGELWALPWAAFVASLLVQTHLSYPVLVATLSVWALTGLAFHLSRARRDSAHWPLERRRALRMGGIAIGVGALCWVQPVLDQITRTGNLANVLSNNSATDAPGLQKAVQIVATVVTKPPFWLRPQYRDFEPTFNRTDVEFAAVSLLVLVATLCLTASLMWRARERVVFAGVVTATLALISGVLTGTVLIGSRTGYGPGNYRWLWSIAGLILVVLIAAAVTTLHGGLTRIDSMRSRVLAMSTLSIGVLLAALSLPHSYQGKAVDGAERISVTRELLAQFSGDDLDDTVLFDRSRTAFGEPYSYPVLIKLQELGVDFEVAEGTDVNRFGTSREPDGDATQRLSLVVPDTPESAPDGARRIAYVKGISPAEEQEYATVLSEVSEGIASRRIGLQLVTAEQGMHRDLPEMARLLAGGPTDQRAMAAEIAALAGAGLLEVDESDKRRLLRFLELREKARLETVGLYVAPIGSDSNGN